MQSWPFIFGPSVFFSDAFLVWLCFRGNRGVVSTAKTRAITAHGIPDYLVTVAAIDAFKDDTKVDGHFFRHLAVCTVCSALRTMVLSLIKCSGVQLCGQTLYSQSLIMCFVLHV